MNAATYSLWEALEEKELMEYITYQSILYNYAQGTSNTAQVLIKEQ